MIASLKNELRDLLLKKRNELLAYEVKNASHIIEQRLFSDRTFQRAKRVAFYLSKGTEVNTFEMIEHAIDDGKEIAVPVTNDEISMVRYTSFDDLKPGKFGVPEPATRIPFTDPLDIIIIPGVAFDMDKHRLGYGKGYYDRFLKGRMVYKIGLAYDFQILERLPRHEHDVKMDKIITEKRVIE